ncbi:MAG TPA: hypothetical protein VLJ20_00625 [Acetobacteraceae bacterium]|nr:hypothetical protein [Acetobacteraceae bacterium]
MGLRPALTVPPISPEEMDQMISRAGLVLNPGQIGDLVLAWRQVTQLSTLIPRNRPLADDFSVAFRLPPPQPKKRVVAKSGAAPRAKTSAKRPTGAKRPVAPKRPASRKTAPKRR